MTPAQRLILAIYTAIVATWVVRHGVISILFRKFDYLTLRSPRFCQPEPPLVSAIIPARDEETTLKDCLDSVCSQTYENLEIVVIDDRSTDTTASIADRAAQRDPRVRVLRIEALPPGWTGKTHALHVASLEARGAWFWFLDADTRHAPESLAIVMEYAWAHRARLASLVPEMRCETFWERVVQPLMGIVLMRSFPLFRANSERSELAFANGQYLLIERDAYQACGGHRAVRDRFVEDIALAGRVKGLGLPARTAIGTEISSTRMYTSLPRIVDGWARILYDALGRRPGPLCVKILEPLVFSQTGALALIVALAMMASGASSLFAQWLLGLSVVHLVLQVSVLYRMYALTSPRTAGASVWYPLAGLVSDWILLKAIFMCWTGRVTWRGTAYGPGPTPLRDP